MKTLLKLILIGFAAVIPIRLAADIGLPLVQHYTKEEHGAGTQTWDIAQDSVGRLFFANNSGLLSFDGVHWNTSPLPNRTIVRSLAIWDQGRVLVGGQNELGYFFPDSVGRLVYSSLKTTLPKGVRDFADVWDIEVLGQDVFCRTSDYLIRFSEGQAGTLEVPGPFLFMAQVAGQLWVQSAEKGLGIWIQDHIEWKAPSNELKDMRVIGGFITPDKQLVFATLDHGFWKLDSGQLTTFSTGRDEFWVENQISTICQLSPDKIAVGTTRAGIMIISPEGELLSGPGLSDALQDNNALSLFVDKTGKLWTGLSYGIDRLDINSPFRQVFPDAPLNGTAYAAALHQGFLYLGTSNGLYYYPWNTSQSTSSVREWQLVPGTQGQVWGLRVINDRLWLGHHRGAFIIDGTSSQYIPGTNGVWNFIQLKNQPEYLVAGTYTGLIAIQHPSSATPQGTPLQGFSESSRFLVQDPKTADIWVSHPYRGVFRLEADLPANTVQFRRYDEDSGLPSALLNHVFEVKEEMVIAGSHGLYTYQSDNDRFEASTAYQKYLDTNSRIIRLTEDSNGNVWYVTEEGIGVLWIEDEGLQKSISHQGLLIPQGELVGGFEQVQPIGDDWLILGLEKGFLAYQYDRTLNDTSANTWQALISEVWNETDSLALVFGGYGDVGSFAIPFHSKQDAFRFDCAAPNFEEPNQLTFRFRLLGQSNKWSEWTERHVKEFTNLSAGNYTFEVQAKNVRDEVSLPARFRFTILPPWYATSLAKAIYAIVALLIVSGLILLPRRRFEREKAELTSEYRRASAAQQEIIQDTKQLLTSLQEQKLADELQHQSQQLATATLHLVQKNEAISHLKTRVENLIKRYPEHPGASDLKKVLRELTQEEQFESDWQQFAAHFDQVHAGFLRRIQEQYPQLTAKDSRLCAYLRMNLSTKEIAPLMNISVRGVEISRYRLRKKLNLDKETNLNDFMANF